MIALLFVSGCAGKDSVLIGGPSSSQMKTSLSHLQFENEQLKTEVAKLKEESRSMEDRLVQEQIHTGDLTARLDDARNILRDRGLEGGTMLGARSQPGKSTAPDDDIAQPRTLPAGRRTKKPRKPPAASISGDLDNLPTASEDPETPPDTISFKAPAATRNSRRPTFPDDSARSLSDDDQLPWQPVASGPSQANPRK